ncbi:periplasmic metalloprotease M23B family protein [Hypericibacter terrae]|uniref:Periplasmic metalloprotease M23B family protein n=1 Tax=Hypericibacter terrae TaxID=2602015 RepID=A0A5J6MDM2_9PROT|nr:M23 family metallopeptidase [Hypericibacter terrae]QEX15462.1 periplasmic metalloprotease M23B family protein [Hypericibacter terrae]
MTLDRSRRRWFTGGAAFGAAWALGLRSGFGAAPPKIEGPMTQGGLLFGHAEPGSRVWLDGASIMVSPAGEFLLGFNRDAPPEAKVRIEHGDHSVEERTLAIAQRSYEEQRINGLPQNTVTPNAEEQAKIAADQEKINAARVTQSTVAWYAHGFDWPALGPISGVYGSVRILNGVPRNPHYGVDIAAPEGAPVRSPADGIVRLAETGMLLTGGTVIIEHGLGLTSILIHMSAVLAHPGLFVAKGTQIGRIGHTGRATGPHCHWGMNWRDVKLDAQLLVPPMPASAAMLSSPKAPAATGE